MQSNIIKPFAGVFLLAVSLSLGACTEAGNKAATEAEAQTETPAADAENSTKAGLPDEVRKQAVEAAVNALDRLEIDKPRDAGRKPAEVLLFFGFEPGQVLMDINAGGGYYTEILSRLVGEEGKVYSHNDEIYASFVRDQADSRYQDRLANVERLVGELPDLELEPGILDGAIMVLAYHDWFYLAEGKRERPADVPARLAAVYGFLKPGGVFGVVDHVAAAGSPAEVGDTLHRVDPGLVKSQMEAAGFEFVAESDILANPEDDHTLNVFNEAIRFKTDRFVYLFRKPE